MLPGVPAVVLVELLVVGHPDETVLAGPVLIGRAGVDQDGVRPARAVEHPFPEAVRAALHLLGAVPPDLADEAAEVVGSVVGDGRVRRSPETVGPGVGHDEQRDPGRVEGLPQPAGSAEPGPEDVLAEVLRGGAVEFVVLDGEGDPVVGACGVARVPAVLEGFTDEEVPASQRRPSESLGDDVGVTETLR